MLVKGAPCLPDNPQQIWKYAPRFSSRNLWRAFFRIYISESFMLNTYSHHIITNWILLHSFLYLNRGVSSFSYNVNGYKAIMCLSTYIMRDSIIWGYLMIPVKMLNHCTSHCSLYSSSHWPDICMVSKCSSIDSDISTRTHTPTFAQIPSMNRVNINTRKGYHIMLSSHYISSVLQC